MRHVCHVASDDNRLQPGHWNIVRYISQKTLFDVTWFVSPGYL